MGSYTDIGLESRRGFSKFHLRMVLFDFSMSSTLNVKIPTFIWSLEPDIELLPNICQIQLRGYWNEYYTRNN
jgi:hypothetical protein